MIPEEFNPGVVLLDMYRIDEVFTSGGMGIVLRARHLGWDIDLAIKFTRNLDDGPASAFLKEIEAWARVGLHPYIITCYYSRRDETGRPFVASEFAEAGSLADWIGSRRLYEGPPEAGVSRMVRIAAHSARGLARAHAMGLIHCDVKSGNFLLQNDGTAKVGDFGLAVEPSQIVVGCTPAYASPEQLARTAVNRQTDIWSWAVTVFEMFAGGICWQGGMAVPASLEDFADGGRKTVGLPQMPESLLNLLRQCLRRSPEDRLSDFDQIADSLIDIHENVFGDPCDAPKADIDLVAADSLNNRAVSLIDLGRTGEALESLEKALRIDPLHPEAAFNAATLRQTPNEDMSRWLDDVLDQSAKAEPWNPVPFGLLSVFHCRLGHNKEAESFRAMARERNPCFSGLATPPANAAGLVLARPHSGGDHFVDLTRFRRLMDKAEIARQDGRWEDVSRYVRMAQDMDGFGRHPRLTGLIAAMRTPH